MLLSSSRKHNGIIEKVDFASPYIVGDYEQDYWLAPYYTFSQRHRRYRRPVIWEELEHDIHQMIRKKDTSTIITLESRYYKGPIAGKTCIPNIAQIIPVSAPKESGGIRLDPAELKQLIIEGLNIGFLIDDLDKKTLVVTTIAQRDYERYQEKELVFEDIHVGRFHVLLLLPATIPPPYPAVIGLHGHRESDVFFRDYHMGRELVNEGYAVVMPYFRAMRSYSSVENRITRDLLTDGFSLMGLRVYETLLVLKYLSYLDVIDSRRIGLLAHSGGSAVATLLVRVTDKIKVMVRDYVSDYMDTSSLDYVHCEVIPSLAPYQVLINDQKTMTPFVLDVGYWFDEKDAQQHIKQFFADMFTKTAAR
ncbi:MAG: hypothetical protein JXD21_07515 [Candidatus Omnitrophica bacterium]|nr:hypothetical protein [Candidatus Omnitrophota bacterium]